MEARNTIKTHTPMVLGKTNDVERMALMALLTAFALLAVVLTAVSHPGVLETVICAALVAACSGGMVWLHRRPVWEVVLADDGVICREKKSGATQKIGWDAFTSACELRNSHGDDYLMLMLDEKNSDEVIRIYQHCTLTGRCLEDGCLCVAMNNVTHDKAINFVREEGLGVVPGCVHVYAC